MSWNLNRSVTEWLWEQQINKRLYFVRSLAIHGEEPSNYSRNVEMERCWFRMSNSDVPGRRDVVWWGEWLPTLWGVCLAGLSSER